MRTSLLNSKIWIVPTATTLAFGIFASDATYILPTRSHELPYQSPKKFEWEDQYSNPYYKIWDKHQDLLNKAEIISNLATKLINESEPLDPAFTRIVNENFWDLV